MKVSPLPALFAVVILGFGLFAWNAFAPVWHSYQAERSLAEDGVPDVALVVRASPTATIVNEQPLVQLTLERHTPEMEYRAEIAQVVPLVYVPRVQPGMQVPIRVDGNDKQRMVIDFARLDSFTAH